MKIKIIIEVIYCGFILYCMFKVLIVCFLMIFYFLLGIDLEVGGMF